MTAEEVDEFLAEPGHLLRIGVVDETGIPLVVPIWYVGEDDAWRDLYREITLRYTPPAWGDAYLQDTIQERRALLRVPLATSEVQSRRMPFREGEDPLAVVNVRLNRERRPNPQFSG